MRKILFLLFTIFLFNMPLYAGASGTTALNFLKIEPTAKASGLAGAFSAVSDDGSAVYYNPAGLSLQNYNRFSFTHLNYIENIKYQFLSYVHPYKDSQVFAGSLYYLSAGDIDSYDNSGALLDEKLKVYDLALGLSYSRKLYGINSGATLKYIQENLAGVSANALALDIGFMYALEEIGLPKTNTSLVIKNIGTKVKFIEKEDPLPLSYTFGISQKLFRDTLTLSSDINIPNDNKYFANIGADYILTDWISLRLGYKHRSSDKAYDIQPSFTGGLGVGNSDIRIDYAFVPYTDFGSTHRFGLSYRFGKAYALNLINSNILKHMELADKYYKNNDMINSYREYKNVLLLDPLNKEANRNIEAIKNKIDNNTVDMYVNKADTLILNGDIISAKELINDLSSIMPDNANARDKLSNINKMLKDEKGKRADTMFEQSLEFFNDEKYHDAISLSEKILLVDPEYTRAKEHIKLAEQEIEKQKEEKRKAELKEKQEKAESLYKKGIGYLNKDNLKKACNLLKEASVIDPGNTNISTALKDVKEKLAESHYNNAVLDHNKGLLKSAINKLKNAVKINGKDEYKAALQSYETELININRDMAEDLGTEGLKEYGAGNLKEAVEIWEKAIKLDPDNIKIQNNLNRAREELKNK